MIVRGGVRSVMTVDVLGDGHRVYRAPTRNLFLIRTHTHTRTHIVASLNDKDLCMTTGEVVMWTDEEVSQPDKAGRQTNSMVYFHIANL